MRIARVRQVSVLLALAALTGPAHALPATPATAPAARVQPAATAPGTAGASGTATAQPAGPEPSRPASHVGGSHTATSSAAVVAPGLGGLFRVGAAKADITPTNLSGVYLGGYGIGPMHLARGLLRHIYARAIAIADSAGNQAVIAALDVQGHFIAYQQGPYGFADIAGDIQHQLGIPASHVLLQSTHTHNGPDDLGVWGGVPTSYLAYVKQQTEVAIRTAVAAETPALLRWGTSEMTGFSGTFGPDSDKTHTGDVTDYPIDNQLRVLQAVSPGGSVIATLVNYSTHATVYGPLDKVSPDWPGATATFLEHDETGIPTAAAYGYPGSVAVVTVGVVGHTWPAAAPYATDPAIDPPKGSDNHDADVFGNAVARMAMAATSHATYIHESVVDGTSRTLTVLNDNPILGPLVLLPVPGFHIYRQALPPYGAIEALTTTAHALRIGDLFLFGAPGEAFPSILWYLANHVHAAAVFPFSLADDQLGYVIQPDDFLGAMQCSTTDEFFFTISPTFGIQLEALQGQNAADLGLRVDRPQPEAALNPGTVPPSTSCTTNKPPS